MMPFGLLRATATFQRLINSILQPHNQYAAAYINDIMIDSTSSDHLQHIANVLRALKEVGLTANLAKCHLLVNGR